MQNNKIDAIPSKWYNEESEYLTSKTKQKIVLTDPSSRAAATQHATQCDVASRSLFISVLLAEGDSANMAVLPQPATRRVIASHSLHPLAAKSTRQAN